VKVAFLFLSVLPFYASSQYNSDASVNNVVINIVPETKEILNVLHIRSRADVNKDGQLKIIPDPTAAPFGAHFREGLNMHDNANPIKRYYLSPAILLSNETIIMFQRAKRTDKSYLFACSALVHELTHYYQEILVPDNYFDDKDGKHMKAYILQPSEFESFSVQSYYFIKHNDINLLNKIMNSNQPLDRKKELLINAFLVQAENAQPLF